MKLLIVCDTLISKLERYGIRGVVLVWIQSSLSKRQQLVRLGHCCSSCLDCGVPQGTILGPKLFVYIMTCKVSSLLKLALFASDTNICCCGENPKESVKQLIS